MNSRELDVYYDPYDVEIVADPYPVFRRLREEAPLYRNEVHDFYALSRYADVERGLVDRETFISGRGGILELIRAGIEMPPGVLIFEDPPVHSVHRGLLSRVFTPARCRRWSRRCGSSAPGAWTRWWGPGASTSSATSGPRCPCG